MRYHLVGVELSILCIHVLPKQCKLLLYQSHFTGGKIEAQPGQGYTVNRWQTEICIQAAGRHP